MSSFPPFILLPPVFLGQRREAEAAALCVCIPSARLSPLRVSHGPHAWWHRASYLQAVCPVRASLVCIMGERCGCCRAQSWGIAVALQLYARKEKQKKSFKKSTKIKKPKHNQPLGSSSSGSPLRRPLNPASTRGPGMGNEPSPIPSFGPVPLLAFQITPWQCGCWLLGKKSCPKKCKPKKGK